MKKERNLLALVFLAGTGIGGYYLWKYLKDKIPDPNNPTGFIIIERYYKQGERIINFPIPGIEFDVVITGMNASRTETVDGYCKIINSDTEEIVFSETINNVEPRKTNFFVYTTPMPETTLNLTVETGRIVDLEEVKDHSIPLEIIPKIPNVYCFTIYNSDEERQINDFLGIDPAGNDIDTYLAALTQAQLEEWKNYWVDIWTTLNRNDIVNFVIGMYDTYKKV